MEKILFWESGDKNWEDGKYYGDIINPDEVYQGVALYSYLVRIWDSVPGDTKIIIPAKLIWDEEEFESLNELSKHGVLEEFLDSLVGKRGSTKVDYYEVKKDVLAWDYQFEEFGSLNNFESEPCYDYFKNSKLTTVTCPEDGAEYEFEILDTYNLDYLKPNSTNFEYGGMGEHAKLHKVREGDTEYLLMHLWSQWQGSELDSGYLLTVDEALEELENHPEIEEIRAWLGVE